MLQQQGRQGLFAALGCISSHHGIELSVYVYFATFIAQAALCWAFFLVHFFWYMVSKEAMSLEFSFKPLAD